MLKIFFVAIGLSMDALAVSLGKGLSMKKLNLRHAFIIALFFGAFQALMPLVGWAVGVQFESYITQFDHWIAFIALAAIGGKMIYDGIHEGDDSGSELETTEKDSTATVDKAKLNYKELFVLAIATSIDALVVGVAFAFLQISILPAVAVIGVTTFVLSFAGVIIGSYFGKSYGKPATIIGGVVLILIGLKILLEHLEILG